ncbi:MAG: hypothetical protein VR70_16275 [Rhodospirillaceae bacterium BRH_c57]|nr:MAG: hypothetical protein VR70_16275 [Rhodospirillaceae bacterium BRH_c57]
MFAKKLLRVAVGVGLAVLMSACALTEDRVDLVYQSADTAAPVSGAESVTVKVAVEDVRPANRDKVSVKKNGYGMEMAAIRANQDVPTLVRQAVEQELRGRGFTIGDGPVFAVIEVARFYADYKTGFWSSDNVSDIQLNVQVRDTSGHMYYGKGISGIGTTEGVMIMDGGPVKKSLETGLAVALRNLMQDPFFVQALIEAQEAVARAAAPAPSLPVGVPAS